MSKEIKVWKCEKCGNYYLSKTAADDCCKETPEPVKKTCRACGCEVDNYQLICQICLNRERFAKAKKVKYSEYEVEYLWDENQEKYFPGKGELEEQYYEDVDDEEFRLNPEMPTWCYGCTAKPFEIDIESAIESAEKEMYDDFDDITDKQELRDFVKAWNAKQSGESYESDYGIVVLLNE